MGGSVFQINVSFQRSSNAINLVKSSSRQQSWRRDMSTKRFVSSVAPSFATGHLILPSVSKAAIRVWKKYCQVLNERPLATKVATAAFIFTTSDLVSQAITKQPQHNENNTQDYNALKGAHSAIDHWISDFDWARASSGGVFGVMGACYLHVWWGVLEKFVEARFPRGQNRMANTLVKVLVDQSLSAPFYYYVYYIVTYMVQTLPHQIRLKDKSTSLQTTQEVFCEANDRAKSMIFPTMKQHWQLWPAIHTLNFYFVPLHQRVMVQNLVLSGWSGYLSHLSNGGLKV